MNDAVKFRRQLGFVHQAAVADRRILIRGKGPILPYLLTELALVGYARRRGRIFVEDDVLESEDLIGQLLFDPDQVGSPLTEAVSEALSRIDPLVQVEAYAGSAKDVVFVLDPEAVREQDEDAPRVYGTVTAGGFFFGAEPIGPSTLHQRTVFTPALAATAAGCLVQESLRVLRDLREIIVRRCTLSLNLRLGRVDPEEVLRGRLMGHSIDDDSTYKISVDQDELGEPIWRIPVPAENEAVWSLFEALGLAGERDRQYLYEPVKSRYFSPFAECRWAGDELVEPETALDSLPDRRVLLGGIGGIGSWVAALLAVSPLEGLHAVLYDYDDAVEVHNLNRQILYSESHLGTPKADAAAERLADLAPDADWDAHRALITDSFVQREAGHWRELDAWVSAFDNYGARCLLGAAAAACNVPFVNAGGGTDQGNVGLFLPDGACYLCKLDQSFGNDGARERWWQTEGVQCAVEDRPSPEIGQSIATTTTVLAGLEILALLGVLAGREDVDHHIQYEALTNEIVPCRFDESSRECSYHRRTEDHEIHLSRFLEDSDLALEEG